MFVSFFPQHESFQVSKGMFGGFFRVVLASLRGAVEAMDMQISVTLSDSENFGGKVLAGSKKQTGPA